MKESWYSKRERVSGMRTLALLFYLKLSNNTYHELIIILAKSNRLKNL